MKKIFTAMAVVALTATSAFAAGELTPSGGVYYPADANNAGVVRIQLESAVETAPTAVISCGTESVNASVYQVGSTGMYWNVEMQEALSALTANTDVTLTVTADTETLVGNYNYRPVFPLTSIAPENYTELTSKAQNVVFTFDQSVSYSSVVITSGSKTTTLDGGSGSVVTVPVLESYWGNATGVTNTLSVRLMGTNVGGVYINNMTDGEGVIGATYTFTETISSVDFLGVNPPEDEATAAELYDYWYVTFMFNNEVTMTENVAAIVRFYDDFDSELANVTPIQISSEDVFGGWNYRAGYFGLEVTAPELPANLPDDFAYLTITLNGVAYNNQVLATQPSAKYYADLSAIPQGISAKKIGSAGINNITSITTQTVDVYNLQGVLVKSNMPQNNINSLPAGLYIINGKKVIIR